MIIPRGISVRQLWKAKPLLSYLLRSFRLNLLNLQQTTERKNKDGFFLGNFTKSNDSSEINKFLPNSSHYEFQFAFIFRHFKHGRKIFLLWLSSSKQCQVAVEYPVSLYSDITTLFPFSPKYSAVHHSKYFCFNYFHIKIVQTLLHYIPILLLHFRFF